MNLKGLRLMLDHAEKQGHVSPDSTIVIMMNDGNGWKSEPIEGVTAPTMVMKNPGKIEKQHELFKPQLGFIRIED